MIVGTTDQSVSLCVCNFPWVGGVWINQFVLELLHTSCIYFRTFPVSDNMFGMPF